MKKTLNLIFTIDEDYIQHFAVALTSLAENNKSLELKVFVMHDIVNTLLLDNVISFFKEKYSLNINLLTLDSELFNHYTITKHISKATYFRLMIADVIPDNIDQALFLDSDLIVNGPLNELADWDFNGNYLFAVNQPDADSLARLNNIDLPAKSYFNAGIMLLNLKLWREDNASAGLLATAKKFMDKLVWWDQDVLNIYFFKRWGELPSKYNMKDRELTFDVEPVIIHYAGSSKPWQYLNNHPQKNLYWHYLKLSPYKGFKYKDFSIKNFLRRIVYFNKTM